MVLLHTFAVMQLSGLDSFAAQDLSRIGLDGWRLTARRWNSVRRWASLGTTPDPIFFRESEGLGNSRVGLDHPSGCGRGRLLVDGERWFNGFVPARRFREQLMTASTHMRYMCWSTIRGAPCADQSRTNTILDAAELPTCGYHHAHRKPQPEIEKKHCRTVSSWKLVTFPSLWGFVALENIAQGTLKMTQVAGNMWKMAQKWWWYTIWAI